MNPEAEQLKSCTRNERRYLSRLECGWCGMEFHKPDCGSMYGEGCTELTRVLRRAQALLEYKPRGKPPGAASEGI